MDAEAGRGQGRARTAALQGAGAIGCATDRWRHLAGLYRGLAGVFAEEADRGRLILWAPMGMIAGIAAFFAADRDPSLTASALAFASAALIAWALRARPLAFPVAFLAACIALGFLSAAFQVWRVAAPVLDREIWGEVTGVVERVEPLGRSTRLVIRAEALDDLPPNEVPLRVRISIREAGDIAAGQRVSVGGLWRPPPSPSRPGGYDFARQAYFLELGAVGAAARDLVILDHEPAGFADRLSAAVDGLRNRLTARITAVVPGDAGAIAAALVTGQRGEISDEANEALRIAGLYHVISISGLHMALFGGTLFVALRWGLALVPGLALRWPIKKWAAGSAIVGAGGYLILSGAEIAAQRSFLMLAILLVAVILDRQAVTMRNLAVSGVAALLIMPDVALGPSFQMSFAAVMVIVAWYETRRDRLPDEERAARRSGFLGTYFGAITATTICATAATAPFAAYHFQRIAVHSLPSNLVATPVVGVVVMPMALLGFLLYPFGLDQPAWIAMGWGVEAMLAVSYWVASWPFATLDLAAFGAAAMASMAFGLAWLALWTTRLKWAGLLPLVAGLSMAAAPMPKPDVYVDAAGRATAVRGPDGTLQILGGRFANFAASAWLTADGDSRNPRTATAEARCDSHGCTAPLAGGGHLSLAWSYAALAEDCGRARIIVTRLIAPPGCRNAALVIDGADLARHGAAALYRDGLDYRIATARGNSERPWEPKRQPPEGPDFAAPDSDAVPIARSGLDLTPDGAEDENTEATSLADPDEPSEPDEAAD